MVVAPDPARVLARQVKVCPIVFRPGTPSAELMVFRHPVAGVQLVKGTLEAGENVLDAALRELQEESGIADAKALTYLGAWEAGFESQQWHLVLCTLSRSPPDRWQHFTSDGGGLTFDFYWHPLAEAPDADWHPVYRNALKQFRQFDF